MCVFLEDTPAPSALGASDAAGLEAVGGGQPGGQGTLTLLRKRPPGVGCLWCLTSSLCFWLLQENYYRPPAQDTCLPCDCFPHGSHSRACDMDTGQCSCKPGVIGRQCNRCDNPFAEVTVLGCEGPRCP